MWRNVRCNEDGTPATYTMPSLGTHLGLTLYGNQQAPRGGTSSDTASEILRTTRANAAATTTNPQEEETMDTYCQFEHGPGNVRIALAPGDTIVTTVISGGTVQIRNSCESMQIALTHHAGVAIHHPIQADMRAARHGIDPAIQVVLESATGNVWIHQRRRQNSAAREQHNRHGRRANDDGERTNPCETEADDTTNPTPGDVPMEATPHNPHGELQGTLGQLRHVTWGSSSESATTVDHNPEVATNATHASREVLATFGTGASDDMIRVFAAWIARHVRARHATSAPNHWCWGHSRQSAGSSPRPCKTTAPHTGSHAAPWPPASA